ncbi:unnamed protein product [Caenorhabditis bovis]|uniref:Leishmanolysin-like peptidase n=1 Tax=Caenorhabditis bovis TaxID=2654633 RepID=A0A8S1FFY7_9PELO|nr:unnamed protein product [Caenorhabditis bovis]
MFRLVLVIGCWTILKAHANAFEPLNIAIINGYGPLKNEIQSALQDSIKWFKKAIFVSRAKQKLNASRVLEASSQQFSWVYVQTTEIGQNYHIRDSIFENIVKSSNFIIVVEQSLEKCRNDPSLLALAQPFAIDRERPKIGKMQICAKNGQRFPNFFDLFRHELLHALGFGTYWPDRENSRSGENEVYTWRTPYGPLKANRTYMDFASGTALAEARKHFNCETLIGIEADGPKKHHLNEYIFGNELMTPILESGPNFFSEISAGILEETFLGNQRWYLVNRQFLKQEMSNYWYGKGFGCEFLTKSCYEFVESARSFLHTFPICSQNNKKFCVVEGITRRRLSLSHSSCRTVIDPNIDNIRADNGVMAPPNYMFSDRDHRFCPFDEMILLNASLLLLLIGFADAQEQHADPIVIQHERNIPVHKTPPYISRKLQDGDELLLSQVVWRHGDRAPVGTYPTDPYKEEAWHNGWGELTQLGMWQQYALGRLLYKKYINSSRPLLSRQYYPKEVYIRSTDVNRTLVSALSNLAGMFENGEAGSDYPDKTAWPRGWTPIPVHTVAENDDPIGNVFAPCPRADELVNEIYDASTYQRFVAENQEFLDFLSDKTGKKVVMPEVYLINDVHYIETLYNMSQPEWITEEVTEKLRNLSQIGTRFLFGIADPYKPELIRLRGGPLLRTIIDKMNQKLSCLNSSTPECAWMSKLKYHAYSAHDTTVYAFLTTFGDEERVIEGGMPHYTASVAVELWNLKNSGPAVRVLFHSAFHHTYHVITHLAKGCPHNSEFCALKVFEKRSVQFLPKNLAKECESKREKWINRSEYWMKKRKNDY